MSHLLLALFSMMLLSNTLAAEQHRYNGTLEQVSRDRSTTQIKEFRVDLFYPEVGGSEAFYVIEEDNTSLPWIEQFGTLIASTKILSNAGVVIGYRHLERNYVIPVGVPYFADFGKLHENAEWNTTDGSFQVSGEKSVNGELCWEVKATIGIARNHTFYVRKSSPLVEAGTQTVFMGPGDRFQLKFERANEKITPRDVEALNATINVLQQMQTRVERDEFDRFQALSPEQVKALSVLLPSLTKVSSKTELAQFAANVNKSLQLQLSRSKRVENLAGTMINQEVPKFTLMSLDGKEISSSSITGKTVLLHFWDYANSTLEQPYGQVGYVDFINNHWSDKGVEIYGVAVNSQLNDPKMKGKAIREIQKLKQFMKLGYDITIDPGSVLNSFGNPTRLGEELPLWVVLSPEGKIVHYHTGFYEVDNRVGLKEIHEIFENLMRD